MASDSQKPPANPAENPPEPPRALKIPQIQVSQTHSVSITDTPTENAANTRDATGKDRTIAVALKHETNQVPTVVASGYGKTAEKILELAYASGVKVRQDADLAQVLAAVELDSPIPLPCFEAVAEILNYLYRLNATPPQFSK